MNFRTGWLCLSLLLASGCAGTRALCPNEGGRPWSEVRSTHFRIQTNLTPEAATATALELEKFRRALLLAWGNDFDPPGSVEVILLRNNKELSEFTQGRAAGFAGNTEQGPLLVMGGNGYILEDTPDVRLQAHELAHNLSHYVLLRQPRWLAEGLARYLETVQIKVSTNEAVLGRPSVWDLGYVRQHGWLDLDELWGWDQRRLQSSAEQQRHYASAWLWVHYLINLHPERFADFETRLARAEDPRRAFAASFQGVEDLKGELRTYVWSGRYAILTTPLPPVPTQVQVRALEPADAHVLRARLFMIAPGELSREERLRNAGQEVAQALKESPTNVEATILATQLGGEPAGKLSQARSLVEAHPDSGRAWDLLADMLILNQQFQEVEQARKRAAELLPDDGNILNSLAWYYAQTNQPEKGLEPARRAVALERGDAATLDTYAALLFQLNRCPEALGIQRRAVDVLHERASDQFRQSLRDSLQEYEAKCGAASPAPKP